MKNPFMPAEETARKLKVLLFGDWGTGKTLAALSFPRVPVITSGDKAAAAPLTPEQEGLLDLAESIADGIESGDILPLNDAESAMIEKVTRFEGLVLFNPTQEELFTATRLVFKGLVRMTGSAGYVVVAAVRPDEGEEE